MKKKTPTTHKGKDILSDKIFEVFRPSEKKMQLYYIEWEDAVASGGGWFSGEDARDWYEKTSMTISEIGWIIEQNAQYICLVSRKSAWGDEEDQIEYGHLQKIPRTWIKRKVNLSKYIK